MQNHTCSIRTLGFISPTLCLDVKAMDTSSFFFSILLYLIFLYEQYYTALLACCSTVKMVLPTTGRCNTGV